MGRFIAPSDGLTIRQPTDKGQDKGNINNPPRYQNLAMGGLNGPGSRGVERNEYAVRAPGSTQRPMPQRKRSA